MTRISARILARRTGSSTCEPTQKSAGEGCNDNSLTTFGDVCDGSGGCSGTTVVCNANQCQNPGTPNGSSTCEPTPKGAGEVCNDSDLTTFADQCDGFGACGGTLVECETPNQCETASTPDGSASCPAIPKPSGSFCNDGDNSTYDDKCDGTGECSGTPTTCDAPGQCQMAGIPDGSGNCTLVPKPSSESCNDGQTTTHTDMCDGAGNCAGTTVICDANQCQNPGTPNGSSTCEPTPKSAGEVCNDNSLTTFGDVCDGSGGCSGTTVVCDANQCQNPGTPNGSSTCEPTPKSAGEGCNDNSLTTFGDVCDGSGGCSGTTVVCDANQCQNPGTPNGSSICEPTPKSAGEACNDNSLTTFGDVCDGSGGCSGTTVVCNANRVPEPRHAERESDL